MPNPRFAAAPVAGSSVPFSVGREITLSELPSAYAWLAARFLPEFDRQLMILGAAHTVYKLTAIWPYRTGRSQRSWSLGIGSVPEANNPPGPRLVFTVEEAERRLSGLKPGQVAYVANEARAPGAASSYVQGLWSGAFSPQLSGGAERPLADYLKAMSPGLIKLAEDRAIGAA